MHCELIFMHCELIFMHHGLIFTHCELIFMHRGKMFMPRKQSCAVRKGIVHLKWNIYPSTSTDVKCRGEKLSVDTVKDTVSHLNCIFKLTSFISVFVKRIQKDEFLQKKKNRCKPLKQGRNTSWNLLETGMGFTSTTCNRTSLQRSCVRSKLGLSIFVVHNFFHQSYTTKGTAVDTKFWPNIFKKFIILGHNVNPVIWAYFEFYLAC